MNHNNKPTTTISSVFGADENQQLIFDVSTGGIQIRVVYHNNPYATNRVTTVRLIATYYTNGGWHVIRPTVFDDIRQTPQFTAAFAAYSEIKQYYLIQGEYYCFSKN